ncbi:unnamed protein product, partial [marine sediment metagenome]
MIHFCFYRFFVPGIPVFVVSLALTTFAAESEPSLRQKQRHIAASVVAPFLKEYCIECHGPKKSKGDIRLDELRSDFSNGINFQNWESVMDTINGGDMPPEDEEQPSIETFAVVSDWILVELREARRQAGGSSGVIRHLNNNEYRNTIRDLFSGMGFDASSSFLDDSGGGSFDNNGGDLFMSSYSLQEYLSAGKLTAERVIDLGGKPEKTLQAWPGKDLVSTKVFAKKNWQKVADCEIH